jgi:uncharacterized membrane protein YphA (DoxX/SURF4 family)
MNRQTVPPSGPFLTHLGPTRISSWRAKLIALLRIVFGIVWGIAAWLKWQPAFINSFTDQVTGAKDGQPPAIQSWISWWGNLVSTNPHFFAYLLACTETTLAVFFIFGILTNLTCVVSMLLSLGIWSVAEGFGGPIQPGKSTDIGTSIMYVIVAAILLAIAAGRYYSVDQWLTPKLGRLGILAAGPLLDKRSAKHS